MVRGMKGEGEVAAARRAPLSRACTKESAQFLRSGTLKHWQTSGGQRKKRIIATLRWATGAPRWDGAPVAAAMEEVSGETSRTKDGPAEGPDEPTLLWAQLRPTEPKPTLRRTQIDPHAVLNTTPCRLQFHSTLAPSPPEVELESTPGRRPNSILHRPQADPNTTPHFGVAVGQSHPGCPSKHNRLRTASGPVWPRAQMRPDSFEPVSKFAISGRVCLGKFVRTLSTSAQTRGGSSLRGASARSWCTSLELGLCARARGPRRAARACGARNCLERWRRARVRARVLKMDGRS